MHAPFLKLSFYLGRERTSDVLKALRARPSLLDIPDREEELHINRDGSVVMVRTDGEEFCGPRWEENPRAVSLGRQLATAFVKVAESIDCAYGAILWSIHWKRPSSCEKTLGRTHFGTSISAGSDFRLDSSIAFSRSCQRMHTFVSSSGACTFRCRGVQSRWPGREERHRLQNNDAHRPCHRRGLSGGVTPAAQFVSSHFIFVNSVARTACPFCSAGR